MKKSRWAAGRGRMVSVPIPADEMMKTINQFPRLPSEAGLIAVKLKRKKQYTGHEKHEMINPEKIIKALIHLKEAGHQTYLDVNIDKNFIERCQNEDKKGYNLINGENENEDFESDSEDNMKGHMEVESALEEEEVDIVENNVIKSITSITKRILA